MLRPFDTMILQVGERRLNFRMNPHGDPQRFFSILSWIYFKASNDDTSVLPLHYNMKAPANPLRNCEIDQNMHSQLYPTVKNTLYDVLVHTAYFADDSVKVSYTSNT